MKIAVHSLEGKKTGECALNPAIFGVDVRPDILARVVRWQLAKRQAGTHSSKGISQISGTTRKPHKQKGTGRARQGSLRSPQFRGGAVIFGPQPRSHAIGLSKRVRRLGLRVALSAKCADSQIAVVDSLKSFSGKTADLARWTKQFSGRVLVVSEAFVDVFLLAARNLYQANALPVAGLNVYDLLRHEHVVFEEAAIAAIEKRLLEEGSGEGA